MSGRRLSFALPLALLALPAVPAQANDYDDDYSVDWAELAEGAEEPPPAEAPETPAESPAPPMSEAPVVDVTVAPQRPSRPTWGPPAQTPMRGLTLRPNGRVKATRAVPRAVRKVIAAANRIARTPYRYGGGHGTFSDTAYDCSGSVSYALHGAGLLNTTLNSTGFMSWGRKGKGRWITIYTNHGHAFMVVGGLRYDTSARSNARGGSRWAPMDRSTRGFVVRHPPGL